MYDKAHKIIYDADLYMLNKNLSNFLKLHNITSYNTFSNYIFIH